jgi:hypothetical protein
MLIEQKLRLSQAFEAAARALAEASGDAAAIDAASRVHAVLDRPKQAGHGDLACSLALQVAKPLKRNPREVAQALDDDGDATLGSVALGNPATGVSIGGALAAASVTVAGTDYTIRVTGQSGAATHGHVVNLRRTAASASAVPGLYAEYYRLSITPSVVAHVPWSSTPNWVGIVPNVNMPNISSAARWPGGPTGRYGIRMRGKITIPTTGTWTFSTNSDDGSTLSINGTLVANNDGLHGATTRAGSIVLPAGEADFDVKFFENGGSSNVTAYWSGPGIATTIIPPSAFTCTPLRTKIGTFLCSLLNPISLLVRGFTSTVEYGCFKWSNSAFTLLQNGQILYWYTVMLVFSAPAVGALEEAAAHPATRGEITPLFRDTAPTIPPPPRSGLAA